MSNQPILLHKILPKYKELKQAGKITSRVEKGQGNQSDKLSITAKRYAQDTGEEIAPVVIAPEKTALENHKAELQTEIALVDEMLGEFK